MLPLFYNFTALEQKNPKQMLAVLNEIRLNTTPDFEVLSRIFNKIMIAQGLEQRISSVKDLHNNDMFLIALYCSTEDSRLE